MLDSGHQLMPSSVSQSFSAGTVLVKLTHFDEGAAGDELVGRGRRTPRSRTPWCCRRRSTRRSPCAGPRRTRGSMPSSAPFRRGRCCKHRSRSTRRSPRSWADGAPAGRGVVDDSRRTPPRCRPCSRSSRAPRPACRPGRPPMAAVMPAPPAPTTHEVGLELDGPSSSFGAPGASSRAFTSPPACSTQSVTAERMPREVRVAPETLSMLSDWYSDDLAPGSSRGPRRTRSGSRCGRSRRRPT